MERLKSNGEGTPSVMFATRSFSFFGWFQYFAGADRTVTPVAPVRTRALVNHPLLSCLLLLVLCLDARQGKIFGKGSSKSSGRAPSANTSPSVTPFLHQKYRKHLSDDVEESDPYASRSVDWSPLLMFVVILPLIPGDT